jgi:hypothetical protein
MFEQQFHATNYDSYQPYLLKTVICAIAAKWGDTTLPAMWPHCESPEPLTRHQNLEPEDYCTLSPVMGTPSGRLLPCNSLSPPGVPDSPLLWFWLSVIRPTEDDTPESMACFMTPE